MIEVNRICFNKYTLCSFVILGILIVSSCSRMTKPFRPEGVPEQSVYDRKMGLWNYTENNGIFRSYYSNGKIAESGELKDGKREGIWRTYSADENSIACEGLYKNDRRDGTWRWYDGDGKLYQTIEYREKPIRSFGFFYLRDYGNENGKHKRFFPNGRIEEEGNYDGGYHSGNMTRYYKNGNTAIVGRYEKDNKVGLWIYYYPEGSVEREENYSANGVLHGFLKNYKPDGSLYQKVRYQNGVQTGEAEIFYGVSVK